MVFLGGLFPTYLAFIMDVPRVKGRMSSANVNLPWRARHDNLEIRV
jgi:hypothetical protein